jgi:hypothetical protein
MLLEEKTMAEVYPSDSELLNLQSDSETGVEYIPTGTAPYYLHFRKLLHRLLLATDSELTTDNWERRIVLWHLSLCGCQRGGQEAAGPCTEPAIDDDKQKPVCRYLPLWASSMMEDRARFGSRPVLLSWLMETETGY